MSLSEQMMATSTSAAGPMRPSSRWSLILLGGLSLVDTTNAKAFPAASHPPLLPLIQTNSGLRASRPRSASTELQELRRLSGLTWDQLARLFGVDRRSLHFWASGKPLSPHNEERLQRLLATIRKLDQGRATENRARLLGACVNGIIPFDLLVEGRFDEVLALLGPGSSRSRVQAAPLSAEARLTRKPPAPTALLGALQEPAHVEKGRLLSSTPIGTKRKS
jgi:transcriptional regulator with XRE-family HTH domain